MASDLSSLVTGQPSRRFIGRPSALRVVGGPAILVTVLAAILFWPRMQHGVLRHWDEAWYAEASREMLAESSWLTVRWNFDWWFEKPPLALWATAGAFHWLGQSEFTARLFAFLCGIGTVGLVTLWASRASGPWVGAGAGLALLCIPEFCRYATRGQLDVPLTLWTTIHLMTFWHGLERPRWHLASGLALGLGILTKGSAAGLGLLVMLAYIVVARDFRPLRQRDWWGGHLVALVVACPWHLHQALVHGEAFWSVYGALHLRQLFLPRHALAQDAPLSFYFEFLAGRQQPVGLLILFTVLAGAWRVLRTPRRSPADRLVTLAWCWTAGMLAALTLCRAKWRWYLVPMYPGAALLAALCWHRLWPRQGPKLLALGLCGAIITASEVLWIPGNQEHEDQIRALAPLVQRSVPPGTLVHVLAVAEGRATVPPIAVPFYCDRPVAVASDVPHLAAIAGRADSPFCVLLHATQLPAVSERLEAITDPSRPVRFEAEILGRSGPIVLARIIIRH